MAHLRTLTILAALAAFAGLAQAHETGQEPAPAQSWQKDLKRADLLRSDLDNPGTEVIQARVDFEPGVASPKHSHPGVEVAFVIDGTFEYQLAGRAPVTLKAGESLYIPAGTPHVAKNVGKGTASELATYIVRKGEPLLKLEP
ncbi:cupin domain-containing protein [Metapseudomonas resinovorans]|uniref:Cupin type-2 domain-containing protein n=1 Tax=Metapseudomonas resinovorans NBRC 106553 TaxID=1245471 RepID=S6BH02_METRE|nr:cupin domain-containing protein [Pseudomonas resinovorans]BAN48409.1 hypothetical protein PCA10_26770 [Pseudomonas resinovorans NBRC 106553]